MAQNESMEFTQSSSNVQPSNEADSAASSDSKDQAGQTRRSSLRSHKQRSYWNSISISKSTINQNIPGPSRLSESQPISFDARRPSEQIATKNSNDDHAGVSLFRRGLIEFLIRKAIENIEHQVKI